MSDYEIITDGDRRRCRSSSATLWIAEETLDETASISVVARRNGVAPNLLYRWRRVMLEGEPWPCRETMTSQTIAPSGRWRVTARLVPPECPVKWGQDQISK